MHLSPVLGEVLKSLLLLWSKLAEESAGRCCTSASHDINKVAARVEHEGLSFLTITLPAFGKAFERALDEGLITRDTFPGFSYRTGAGIPRFLGGFLELVFDRCSGVLLDDASYEAILAVRQLTLMFGKILLPCSDARVEKAFEAFVECEQEVREADNRRTAIDLDEFRHAAITLFGNCFAELHTRVDAGEMIPKHGPGATADGLKGNRKFLQREWTARLEKVFSSSDYLIPSHSYWERLDEIDLLEPGQERPVRVVAVPKTLKTPRIIAIEPTCMQYVQQAVLSEVKDVLLGHDTLRHMIGLDDQTPNQRMALEGSRLGKLATLDLSEASDRVSNQLVREMLAPWPSLFEAVDACRSRHAEVPGHGEIQLAKYASMGSALTFPVEAMVFLAIIFVGISRQLNTPLRREHLEWFHEEVRVFGDDIIVPVEFVRSVIGALQDFGLVVNHGKSFWSGKFRESCGKEYYEGEDVSIVRVRRVFPTSPKDAQEVISVVSLRNQLYFAGYWQTVRWLDDEIVKVIRHFPTVLPSSPVQGRHSFLGYHSEKMCRNLHKPLVKGYVVSVQIPKNQLGDEGALLKFHIKPGESPVYDAEHLERSGRPVAVNIKLRMASAT